jgi:hypothetical protein
MTQTQTTYVVVGDASCIDGPAPARHVQPVPTRAASRSSGSGPALGFAAPADLADVARLARAALSDGRSATALSHDLIEQIAVLQTAVEGFDDEHGAAESADRLANTCRLLAEISGRLLAHGQAMHTMVARMRPSHAARMASLARMLNAQKDAHDRLVSQAELMVSGGPAILARQVASAAECPLGQWWVAAGRDEWGDINAFLALDKPHRRFHGALAGLVFAYPQGRLDAAEASLADLQAAQRLLAEQLDVLSHSIVANGRGYDLQTHRAANSEARADGPHSTTDAPCPGHHPAPGW